MAVRYKSILKGAGSYFIKALRSAPTGNGGAFTAQGSYAIFMRYLIGLNRCGISFEDKVVLEFGPGSSCGMGIAALLSGAMRYYSVDLIDHTLNARNLAIFDEIVRMFQAREHISTAGWCAKIFPFVDETAFPTAILPDSLLNRTLAPDRLHAIRSDLETGRGMFFRPRAAAHLGELELDEPADIILSESVLEHVDDLDAAYEAFARWLASDGVMAHLIDYSSHNISRYWNGHWQCSKTTWSLVRGKRYYLINRVPHQVHIDLMKSNGIEVVDSQILRRVDGLSRDEFSPEFRGMSFHDATVALAALICRRVTQVESGVSMRDAPFTSAGIRQNASSTSSAGGAPTQSAACNLGPSQ